MSISEAQKRAKAKYKKKLKIFHLEFTEEEIDLYMYLKSQDNMARFLKNLIRESMLEKG